MISVITLKCQIVLDIYAGMFKAQFFFGKASRISDILNFVQRGTIKLIKGFLNIVVFSIFLLCCRSKSS